MPQDVNARYVASGREYRLCFLRASVIHQYDPAHTGCGEGSEKIE
jgi:hypothetical protein